MRKLNHHHLPKVRAMVSRKLAWQSWQSSSRVYSRFIHLLFSITIVSTASKASIILLDSSSDYNILFVTELYNNSIATASITIYEVGC
jgi:hypothetical protein